MGIEPGIIPIYRRCTWSFGVWHLGFAYAWTQCLHVFSRRLGNERKSVTEALPQIFDAQGSVSIYRCRYVADQQKGSVVKVRKGFDNPQGTYHRNLDLSRAR